MTACRGEATASTSRAQCLAPRPFVKAGSSQPDQKGLPQQFIEYPIINLGAGAAEL